MRSTVMCSFLVSILVFPILANIHYILGLWLKNVPEYTVVFTQLVLINGLIDATNGPTIAPALATGKIRNFYIITSVLFFFNLPISYIVLKLGAGPQMTMIISIVISLVTALVRAYLLRSMIGLPFKKYLLMFLRLIIGSAIIWGVIYNTLYNSVHSFVMLIYISLIVCVITTALYVLIIFDKSDVKSLFNLIRRHGKHI